MSNSTTQYLDAQDRSISPLRQDVDIVWPCYLLRQAAAGIDVAYYLSLAMAHIDQQCHRSDGAPLAERHRGIILTLISRVHACALKTLPTSYPRSQIAAGLDALKKQVALWCETHDQGANPPTGYTANIRAVARMFRNDLHNISLADELATVAQSGKPDPFTVSSSSALEQGCMSPDPGQHRYH